MRVRKAFTIIELLVSVAIIAMLIGILLPAISKARTQAKVTQSLANLRNLGTAHASYQAEWNDRQFTLIDDNLSSLGSNADTALDNYRDQRGGHGHPGVVLGWGYEHFGGGEVGPYTYFEWDVYGGHPETKGMIQPIVFVAGAWTAKSFGSFRLANCSQFNQYVSGRYYAKSFFAPNDTVVMDTVQGTGCFDDPGEFCTSSLSTPTAVLEKPIWCSYVLSPAAMFHPQIMRPPSEGGWLPPWFMAGSFKSPAAGQCRYPTLKTHMIEHHWLQNRGSAPECNPAFLAGSYDGCEPYFFNHSWDSSPATLFYDGHIETVGVRRAERADGRVRTQSGGEGLWSRDTSFGALGYFIDSGYDLANTSFHVLTTSGILGRDVMAD